MDDWGLVKCQSYRVIVDYLNQVQVDRVSNGRNLLAVWKYKEMMGV